MPEISLDLRRRIVRAYKGGKTSSYEATAEMFGVGRATVNRLLRRERETGDVVAKARGGNNPRRIDLEWLRVDADNNPDARLVERAEAWYKHCGKRVGVTAIWRGLHAIGWTHKKRRR